MHLGHIEWGQWEKGSTDHPANCPAFYENEWGQFTYVIRRLSNDAQDEVSPTKSLKNLQREWEVQMRNTSNVWLTLMLLFLKNESTEMKLILFYTDVFWLFTIGAKSISQGYCSLWSLPLYSK